MASCALDFRKFFHVTYLVRAHSSPNCLNLSLSVELPNFTVSCQAEKALMWSFELSFLLFSCP